MKQKASPIAIAITVTVLLITMGVYFWKQIVYTEPTPKPNRGVDTGVPTAPSKPDIPNPDQK